MEDVSLIKKIAISLLVINLAVLMFYKFTTGTLSVSNVNIKDNPVTKIQANVIKTANNTAGSFDVKILSTPDNPDLTQVLLYIPVYIINFFWKFINLFGNIVALLALNLKLILVVTFSFTGNLLGNTSFGIFQDLYALIAGAVIMIGIFYGLNLIWNKVISSLHGGRT